MSSNNSQEEKSKAREFLQPAQYYVSTACKYCAKHWHITGVVLAPYSLAVLIKFWSRDISQVDLAENGFFRLLLCKFT